MSEMRLRKVGLSLLLIGGMAAFVGCSGDDDPDGNKDASTNVGDTGGNVNPDAAEGTDSGMPGPDSGPRPDSGVDGGMMSACPQGDEGCPCTPAGMCNDMELTCISWPVLRMADPQIRSCVRTCDDDTQCAASTLPPAGTPKVCTDFFLPTIGVGGICSNTDTAAAGEACKGSRRGNVAVSGCEDGLSCLTNQVGGDNGTCAQLCIVSTSTPTGGCEGATPFCNPGASGLVVTSTSGEMEGVGVCAVGRLVQGSICSSFDLTRSCDTSEETVAPGNGHECITWPDLPENQGTCVEICALTGGTCGGVEPAPLGRQTCGRYSTQDNNAGLCQSNCSNYPDDCNGTGQGGAGRFCQNTWVFDQMVPLAGFCVDRLTPALGVAELEVVAGTPSIVGMPPDCRPLQGSNGDFYRCPEGSHCEILQDGAPGVGVCFQGCDATVTATASGCDLATTSSTCFGLAAMGPEGVCANVQ